MSYLNCAEYEEKLYKSFHRTIPLFGFVSMYLFIFLDLFYSKCESARESRQFVDDMDNKDIPEATDEIFYGYNVIR